MIHSWGECTLLEAFLQGRKPLGNDINPLSAALLEARINPPTYEEVEARLNLAWTSN